MDVIVVFLSLSVNDESSEKHWNSIDSYSFCAQEWEPFRLAEEICERQAEEQGHVGQHKDPVP